MRATLATVQRFRDFDAQAEQLNGFDQRYDQLGAGAYEGSFFTASSHRASVFVETTNRTLWQRGAGPTGHLSAVVLINEGTATSTCNGVEFTTRDLFLIGPGGSYNAIVATGAIPAVVDLSITDDPRLGHHAARLEGVVRRVSDPGLAERFRRFALAVLRSYDHTQMHATLPDSMVDLLITELTTSQAADRGSAHRSAGLVARAHLSMAADPVRSRRIPDLAAELGVSRRTLEKSFADCIGMSPAHFWRLLALNNMRRHLETGQCNVTRAAVASGFRHLGRASGEYRSLFGELPSVTAERSLQLPRPTG